MCSKALKRSAGRSELCQWYLAEVISPTVLYKHSSVHQLSGRPSNFISKLSSELRQPWISGGSADRNLWAVSCFLGSSDMSHFTTQSDWWDPDFLLDLTCSHVTIVFNTEQLHLLHVWDCFLHVVFLIDEWVIVRQDLNYLLMLNNVLRGTFTFAQLLYFKVFCLVFYLK